MITTVGDVFAYVAVKPCGCLDAAAASDRALRDLKRYKWFREQWDAGKVRLVMSREEWLQIPWKCPICQPN